MRETARVIDADDLRQEYELERAVARREGRRPRPKKWVEADYFRRELGRTDADGEPRRRRSDMALDRLPNPRRHHFPEFRAGLAHRAIRQALSLPIDQRAEIVLALRCLASRFVEDRVRAWIQAYPNVRATHAQIGRDIGATREAVCRALSRMRRNA